MRSASIRGLLTFVVMLFVSVAASAQEATFTGTVTDSTGGVLPGVTITAVHEASGNTFTYRHRRARRIPAAGARRQLPAHGRAERVHHREPESPDPHRPDGGGRRADDAVLRAGDRHRHG